MTCSWQESQNVRCGLTSVSHRHNRLRNDLYCVGWGVKLYSNQTIVKASILYSLEAQRHSPSVCPSVCLSQLQASRCSIDGEMTHRCCHLPNNVENIECTPDVPYAFSGLRPVPQNCPIPWGFGPAPDTWFPGPTLVHTFTGTSIGSVVFAGLTVVTRETHRPRYIHVCSNRPRICTAYMRCGLKLKESQVHLSIATGWSIRMKLERGLNRMLDQCACELSSLSPTHGALGVNSLPKTVTRQRLGCDLNPGPSVPESSTLSTRLPSHPS